MSEIVEIIDTLETRLQKLLGKMERMEQSSAQLRQELQNATKVIEQQSEEIATLKKQYDSLKMASSLLGSEENKRETKLKINSLIREIDYCIAQLSD